MKPKQINLTPTTIRTLLRIPGFRLSLMALAGGLLGFFGSLPADGCDEIAFSLPEQLHLNGPSLNVVVADFNGDSKADVAATNDQNVIVYFGDGAGGFGLANTFAAGVLPRGLAVGDFDGDGNPDLAVANFSDVSILINDGQGGFKAPVNYPADNSPIAIGVGDLNSDGQRDLAVVNSQNNDVSILLGDGAGHFGPPTNFPAGELPYALAAGDFNSDGNIDLVISTYQSQEVIILAGDGLGNFTTVNSYPLGGNATNVVIGDFNGDHNQDVAVGVYNIFPDNHIAIFLGDGAGNFTAGSSVPAFDPVGILTTDFDGDGNLDLATTLYNAPAIEIALGDGAGGFVLAHPIRLPQHPLPFGLATGDFNSDARSDLAVANYGNGNVTILLNLPSIEIKATDPTAYESDRDRGRFQVRREGCTAEPLEIQYSVSGTARPGIDYRALPGTVTIAADRKFASIPVVPLGNTLPQDGATVIVTLTPEPYYGIGKDGADTVTIYNNK